MVDKKVLVEKWENAEGKMSIKGIKDPYVKENIAQMLENQERKDWNGNDIFTEASQGIVNQGPASLGVNGDDWKFRPVALALVRRTFPDLFANKVVGVQAMSTPVGLAYALRVLYDMPNGYSPDHEAAWDNVDYFGGYTGVGAHGTSAVLQGTNVETSAATGIYDTSGTGAVTSAAEGWTLNTTSGAVASDEWPQLKLRIDQTSVTAATRKLAASFSLEAAQDIRAMHGVDIEREMVNVLQYEITAELDRELLMRMKTAATNTANGGAALTPIDCTNGTIDGRWSGEKFMTIVANIIHQANIIATTTRRGAGNFVVVSPSIATALQGAGHQFVQYTSNVNPSTTMAAIGKLNGTLDVYRDQYARIDYGLVGYKGPGISDTGIIFSPYIMGLTNRAISPLDFSPRIGVMARYSITDSLLGSGRYYRLIPFVNVNQLIATA